MGGTPNVQGMLNDPDFQSLAPLDKRNALSSLTGDKSFTSLSDADTMRFVSSFQPAKAAPPVNPITASVSKATGIGPGPGILGQKWNEIKAGLAGAQEGGGLPQQPTALGNAAQFAGILGTQAAQLGVGPGLAEGINALPSTVRAGQKFQEVMGAARDVAIKPGEAVSEAMRGKELASRGGSLPKVLRDFVRRTSDVDAPPVTYEEARDFYTNTRLAMSERLATKPNMWRQVTIFKEALGDAIEDAAASVGKLDVYQSAMSEYRNAVRLKRLGLGSLATGAGVAASKLPVIGGVIKGAVKGSLSQ